MYVIYVVIFLDECIYAATYVFITVFVRMLDRLQYIIMIILQIFMILVLLYLNNVHHTLETLTIFLSHYYHLLYSL